MDEIKGLGKLHPYKNITDWDESDDIFVKFFNKKLCFIFPIKDDYGEEYFEKNKKDIIEKTEEAILNFLVLNEDDKEKLTKWVYESYIETLRLVDIEPLQVDRPEDVWKFITPKDITIKYREKDKKIYIAVNCECEWEKEHGLYIVFQDGKRITRVSEYDGHITNADAHNIPDEEDKQLNS